MRILFKMTRWDIDKVVGVMWVAGIFAKPLVDSMEKETGICFTEHLVHVKNHNFLWCVPEAELEKVGTFLVKRFKNKRFAENFVRKYRVFEKRAIKELNEMDKIDVTKLSNEEVFTLLEKSINLAIQNFDFGFIIEPMDFVMPKMLQEALTRQGYTAGEIADMLAIADISFLNKEEQELIKIEKAKQNQRELLKKHADKYRWLHSAHGGRRDIPFSFFEDKLRELVEKGIEKELLRLKNFKKDILKRKKLLLKRKPVDKKTEELLSIADIIAPPHDRRKELFLRSIYTIDPIRTELSKRYSYSKEETSWFQLEHFLKLKEGKRIDHATAMQFAENSLLYINTKKKIWKYYTGEQADAITEKELKMNIANVSEIKGMCASQGTAKGKVKIINGVQDMGKMEQGAILVSSMTRPEFVSAMKKAAAIVTDEGGVTCHAAIVSRELGIPCIIGTKIATSVLRDGDIVEINANEGCVKILAKEK